MSETFQVVQLANRGDAQRPYSTIFLSDGYTVGFGAGPDEPLGCGLWPTRRSPDRLSESTLAHIRDLLTRLFPAWEDLPGRLRSRR